MTQDEAWEGLLDPDERIVWQGKPSGKFKFRIRNPFAPIFFIILLSTPAYTLLTKPVSEGTPSILALVLFALWGLIGIHVMDTVNRRRARYMLTNRRAIIRFTPWRMPKISSFPITPQTILTLDQGAASAVWFGPNLDRKTYSWKHSATAGFELIEAPGKVYQLLHTVQRGDA